MNSKDRYVQKMEDKLDEWSAEIDLMAAKAGKVAAGARAEYHEQVAVLRGKQEEARQKLKEAQQSGEGAWEDLAAGIDLAWTAMREAVTTARTRFK
jgi:hypothetical protein